MPRESCNIHRLDDMNQEVMRVFRSPVAENATWIIGSMQICKKHPIQIYRNVFHKLSFGLQTFITQDSTDRPSRSSVFTTSTSGLAVSYEHSITDLVESEGLW